MYWHMEHCRVIATYSIFIFESLYSSIKCRKRNFKFTIKMSLREYKMDEKKNTRRRWFMVFNATFNNISVIS